MHALGKRGNQREFPVYLIPVTEGSLQKRRVRRIVCSKCRKIDDLTDTDKPMPHDVIERKFNMRHWEVGRTAEKDVCPDCQPSAIRRRLRAQNVAGVNAMMAAPVVRSDEPLPRLSPTMPEEIKPKKEEPAMPAASPNGMTTEDRRLIFAKLNDVYLSGAQGYADGNSDASVAKDLGCPMVWVSEVREGFFGPARDNSEIRDLLQKIDAAAASITARVREYETGRALVMDSVRILQKQGAAVEELKRTGEYLVKRAEEIRKRVG